MDKFRRGMLGGAIAVFLGATGSYIFGVSLPNPWVLSVGVASSVLLSEVSDSSFQFFNGRFPDTNNVKKKGAKNEKKTN